MTDTPRTPEQVLAAVLAKTGPVTVYSAQVDAADPAEVIVVHEAFGPQAHREPMTLCLRGQYGELFGPVGSFADGEDQLTLTDTAGRHAVIVRHVRPATFDLAVDPAGVVLAPAHADALRQFLLTDEQLLSIEDRAAVDAAYIEDLRAATAREVEEQRQETGRQRTRADTAEQLLRDFVDADPVAIVDDTEVLWHGRVLLGLDGRTGRAPATTEARRG